MTNPNRITDRIRKLLRLSASPNPHESELAMSMALRLATAYHVCLDDLTDDPDTRRLIHAAHRVGHRFTLDRKLAQGIAGTYFNVSFIFDRPDIIVVGTQTDIDIAGYVVEFLVQACRRCLSRYIRTEIAGRRKPSNTKRRNWTRGFFYGVGAKLKETMASLPIETQSAAVILAGDRSRREAYMEDNFSLVTSRKLPTERANTSAIMAGFFDGKNVTIHKPIGGSAVSRLQLS